MKDSNFILLGFDYRRNIDVLNAERFQQTPEYLPWSHTKFCSADPSIWPSLFQVINDGDAADLTNAVPLAAGEAPYFEAMGLWNSFSELMTHVLPVSSAGVVVALHMEQDHLADMPKDHLFGAMIDTLPDADKHETLTLDALGFDVVDLDGASLLAGTAFGAHETVFQSLNVPRTSYGLIENFSDACSIAQAIAVVLPEHEPVVPCLVSKVSS